MGKKNSKSTLKPNLEKKLIKNNKDDCLHNYLSNNEKNFIWCTLCGNKIYFNNGSVNENVTISKAESEIQNNQLDQFKDYTTGSSTKRITIEVEIYDQQTTLSIECYAGHNILVIEDMIEKYTKLNNTHIYLQLKNQHQISTQTIFNINTKFLLFLRENFKYFPLIIENENLFILPVHKNQTISEIKQAIIEEYSLIDDFILCHRSKKFDDNQILEDCGILNKCKLNLYRPIPVYTENKDFLIYVKTQSKELYSVNVDKNDKISDIQQLMINYLSKSNINAKFYFQFQTFKNKFPNNDSSLSDLNVTHNDVFFAIWSTTQQDAIQLAIKNLRGFVRTVFVYPENKVEDLKKIIEYIEGTTVDSQRLIFAGKQLEDGRELSDYRIREATIHLVLRLTGGKPVILFYNYEKNCVINTELELDKNVWEFSHIYPKPHRYIDNTIAWNMNTKYTKDYSNSIMIDSSNNKEYTYLFWEAVTSSYEANQIFQNNLMKQFYCFKSENACDEIDILLKKKGLNITEREDLITYWMSEITSKKYVIVSFLDNLIYNKIAKLRINPEPNKMIRVFMLFKPTDEYFDYEVEDKEELLERDYIIKPLVVEWGAMNVDKYS